MIVMTRPHTLVELCFAPNRVLMSIVKRHLRLALIEEICIDKGALVLDTATDEVYFSADEDACLLNGVSGMGKVAITSSIFGATTPQVATGLPPEPLD